MGIIDIHERLEAIDKKVSLTLKDVQDMSLRLNSIEMTLGLYDLKPEKLKPIRKIGLKPQNANSLGRYFENCQELKSWDKRSLMGIRRFGKEAYKDLIKCLERNGLTDIVKILES